MVLSCAGRREDPAPIGPDLIEPWLRAMPMTAARPALATAIHSNGHLPGPVIEAKPDGHSVIGDQRTLEDIEREAILETLARFNGHRQRTAQSLGIGVRTLGLKLKKWKQDRLIAETV